MLSIQSNIITEIGIFLKGLKGDLMVNDSNGQIIEAAGGLLWIEDKNVKKLAIVHRTSREYGDEWILPKGKFDAVKDKNLKDTAIREVHEETGLAKERIIIGNFAGSISYVVDDEPKIVLYWNMTFEGEFKFKKSKEIEEIKWLPINEAINTLTYPKERNLIKIPSVSTDFLKRRKPANLKRLRSVIKSTSHKRLEDAIPMFESELNTLIEMRVADSPKKVSPWAEEALRMIQNAKHALRLCEIELGWAFLNEAKLLSTHLLDRDDGSLIAVAQATLNEAETKLKFWRKSTVQDLLGKNGVLKKDFNKSKSAFYDLFEARKILIERHDNMHRARVIALFQLKILTIFAFILVPFCIVALWNFSGQLEITNLSLLVSIILFGALGGTISSMITVYRGSSERTIPDQILDSWFTISRPIFGAMAALAVSIFFYAGLIQLGNLTNYVVLAASFLAGLSERFFLSAVGKGLS